MLLKKYMDCSGNTGISGMWSVSSSAGTVEGTPADVRKVEYGEMSANAAYDGFRLGAQYTASPEKVYTRTDTYENTSAASQMLYRMNARFCLPGGEYEAYTQKSSWEFESEGVWAPLKAKAGAWNRGLRPEADCAPVLAVWNRQTGRGMVFHVFPACSWKLTASMCGVSRENFLVIEAGVNDRDFHMTVAPGEKITLPKIVYYEFQNKEDLDCARLHRWFIREYPRREQPVIFNTWMAAFDRIAPEAVMVQAQHAAKLGTEYFVIDAGWFGKNGRWFENIGEWVENPVGAMGGRMKEVAEGVHRLGMKFGLWMEPERALENVTNRREHPEWFWSNGTDYLTDFGNDEARSCMTDTAIRLARTYGIDYFKFDFNADIAYDPTGSGFLRWHEGHRRFLTDLRAALPGIYLENCASGGTREDMYNLTLYDSVWMSDNHSIYEQTRILKDTIRRMAPCCIERWPVIKDAQGFINYSYEGTRQKLLSCDDAEWNGVRGLKESWLRAFCTGGPLGLSFELDGLTQETREIVKSVVEDFKASRYFWQNASASILCDTPWLLILEYADENAAELRIVTCAWNHRQPTVTVYPHVCADKRYTVGDRTFTGAELLEDGITVPVPEMYGGSITVIKESK